MLPAMPKSPAKKVAQKSAPTKEPAVHTLDSLHHDLGKPNEALAKALFLRLTEGALVEVGVRIDSISLIDDVPGFVSSAIEIQKHLTPAQRPLLKLPSGIAPLLVAEAITLRSLHAEFSATSTIDAGSKAQRDTVARRELREGVTFRDIVYDALRNALGPDGMSEVDAVIGTAETHEALATGLSGMAKLLRKLRKQGSDDLALFDAFELDEACAAALDEKAARVRKAGEAAAAPEKRVTQRRLDLQDGRVAHLIGIVRRAFRAANRADSSILVPKLRASAWLFESRSGKSKAQPPPAAPSQNPNS